MSGREVGSNSPKIVTILDCTNAAGNFITPTAAFKRTKHRSEFVDGFLNGSLVTVTDCRLISKDCFRTWLCHFQVSRSAGDCLLLLDGHASNKNLQALEFCEENNIYMVCLPSHTTHRLQSLGRSIIKSPKSY